MITPSHMIAFLILESNFVTSLECPGNLVSFAVEDTFQILVIGSQLLWFQHSVFE